MHPRQASVFQSASDLANRIAAKKRKMSESVQPPTGQILLWKYEDPDGKTFYLEEKKMTVRSPFSGKTFPAKPQRHTPAQVGKEMREDRKTKTAAQPLFWEYMDDEGNSFLLPEKRMTVRSPYTGKTFTSHPIRHTLQDLRDLPEWGVETGDWDVAMDVQPSVSAMPYRSARQR